MNRGNSPRASSSRSIPVLTRRFSRSKPSHAAFSNAAHNSDRLRGDRNPSVTG